MQCHQAASDPSASPTVVSAVYPYCHRIPSRRYCPRAGESDRKVLNHLLPLLPVTFVWLRQQSVTHFTSRHIAALSREFKPGHPARAIERAGGKHSMVLYVYSWSRRRTFVFAR